MREKEAEIGGFMPKSAGQKRVSKACLGWKDGGSGSLEGVLEGRTGLVIVDGSLL